MEGYDLLARETCWVPWDVVHTDYTLPTVIVSSNITSFPAPMDWLLAIILSEAVSSAICELVERDAVAVWHARNIRDAVAVPSGFRGR